MTATHTTETEAAARGYLETRVKTMSGVLSSGFP